MSENAHALFVKGGKNMRTVVWAVVGVIAVAAIAIVIHMKNQDAKDKLGGMPTAAEVKHDIDRLNKKADEYVAEVKKLRETMSAQLTAEKKAKLARADSIIVQIRAGAAKLAVLKGDQLVNAKHEIQDLLQSYADTKHEVEKK
jgi:hypothetical protein